MSFYLMHRGWMDNELFSDEPFTDRLAWMWLIQEASFEPHKIRYKNKMIEVGIGQVPISYRRLVEKWKWGIHRVRNFLDLLESEQMITRETATGFLIVTVCNYEKYQKPSKIPTTQTATPTATLPTTQTATNINKTKELKEIKEKNMYPQEFEIFWKAYPQNNGTKKLALAKFIKALETTELQIILDGAKRYAEYCQQNKPEIAFRLHAATWLNQAGWETQYATLEPEPEKQKASPEQILENIRWRLARGLQISSEQEALLHEALINQSH